MNEQYLQNYYFAYRQRLIGALFTLREGNIADYKGDAIVLPCRGKDFQILNTVAYEKAKRIADVKLDVLDVDAKIYTGHSSVRFI